ncbi:MAG: tilS [Hyphomonadaceae bacterium]|nr:MAG: tilS [Hyphomonadaceae bacterium]
MAAPNPSAAPLGLQSKFFNKMDWLLEKFGSKFIIGLSGGGDSLALTKLCAEYQIKNQSAQFQAVIIDHAIAIGSDDVAAQAAKQAQAMGIDARILRVSVRITTSIQEEARKRRYELLNQAALEFGAKTILLAHNFEDQIETLLFRMLRKTGLDGLAGMRDVQASYDQKRGETFILARPLLDVSRDSLRKYLAENGIEYYDDPANENQDFSRVKIRKTWPKIRAIGFSESKLLKIRDLALQLREMSEKQTREFLSTNLIIDAALSKISLNLSEENVHIRQRALSAIIQALSGKQYLEYQKIESLAARISEANFKSATLANVQIKLKNAALVFSPAPKRKNQAQPSCAEYGRLRNAIFALLNDFDI